MSLFENKNSPEKRRKINSKKIKKLGIAWCKNLPLLEDSSIIKSRDIDNICKRAIACLISTQIACDIAEEQDYNESRDIFTNLLHKYGVQDALLGKEKTLFNGTFTEQDAIDIMWTYEAYWALVWALGLVKDIEMPDSICDCQKAVFLVSDCQNYEEFKDRCKLRNIEEILDMLDLYYQYHWAVTEKRINPNTYIGDLNSDVVIERRRGLEWLISNIDDWNEISLDT